MTQAESNPIMLRRVPASSSEQSAMNKRYIVVADCGEFTGEFLDESHDIERDQTVGRLTAQADSYAEAFQLVLEWIENPADLDGLIIWPADEPMPAPVRHAA